MTFQARRLTRGLFVLGPALLLCLPLGGCGASPAAGPRELTEEEKQAEAARRKQIETAFREYQKTHRPDTLAGAAARVRQARH